MAEHRKRQRQQKSANEDAGSERAFSAAGSDYQSSHSGSDVGSGSSQHSSAGLSHASDATHVTPLGSEGSRRSPSSGSSHHTGSHYSGRRSDGTLRSSFGSSGRGSARSKDRPRETRGDHASSRSKASSVHSAKAGSAHSAAHSQANSAQSTRSKRETGHLQTSANDSRPTHHSASYHGSSAEPVRPEVTSQQSSESKPRSKLQKKRKPVPDPPDESE